MLDIGFTELLVIAIVGLLVIGPDRLPEALRTLGLWVGRMRRSFTNVKAEIEKEIGMDEIRRQLHNEAVMEEMKRIERDVRQSVDSAGSQPRSKRPAPAESGSRAEPPPDHAPESHPDAERLESQAPANEQRAERPASGDTDPDATGRDDDGHRG